MKKWVLIVLFSILCVSGCSDSSLSTEVKSKVADAKKKDGIRFRIADNIVKVYPKTYEGIKRSGQDSFFYLENLFSFESMKELDSVLEIHRKDYDVEVTGKFEDKKYYYFSDSLNEEERSILVVIIDDNIFLDIICDENYLDGIRDFIVGSKFKYIEGQENE